MRLIVALVLLPVCGYQVRHSLDVMPAHAKFIHLPLRPQPMTARVQDEWRVTSVNGVPVTGYASWLSTVLLVQSAHLPIVFHLTRPNGRSVIHRPIPAGCTCGGPTDAQVWAHHVVAPWLCIAAGAGVLLMFPRSSLAWCFLGLMLAVSQVRLIPPEVSEFLNGVDVRLWDPASRIPAVAYEAFFRTSLPAWILLFISLFFGVGRALASIPLFGISMVSTALAISWSENYVALAPFYQAVEPHGRWLIAVGFACAIYTAWGFGKRTGIAVAVLAIVAGVALPFASSPIALVEVQLAQELTPGVVGSCFAAAAIAVVVAARYSLARAVVAALLAPTLLFHAYVNVLPMFRALEYLDQVFVSGALGLAGLVVLVVRREIDA